MVHPIQIFPGVLYLGPLHTPKGAAFQVRQVGDSHQGFFILQNGQDRLTGICINVVRI